MKSRIALIMSGALLGVAAGWLFYRKDRRRFHRVQRTEPETHAGEVDLNTAPGEQFLRLGLDREAVSRIIENRPYRNKLDLVARIIVPEDAYEKIKHRIAVSGAGEPVKVA